MNRKRTESSILLTELTGEGILYLKVMSCTINKVIKLIV